MSDNTYGSGQPTDAAFPDPATLSFEQARQQLVETVRVLELGQMSLDESLKYWEYGEALAKRCEQLLEGASKRVEAAIQQRDATAQAPQAE